MRSFFAALFFVLAACAYSAQETPKAVVNPMHRAVLKTHCQGCHGEQKQKGKFRVDDLPEFIDSVQGAQRWQKVLNAMNSGEMPPDEEKQIESRVKADILEDLANGIVSARRSLSDQHGVIALRRLNRREYGNTLRELLGAKIDVSELPSDTRGGGFDTVGASLFMSGNQFEQYEALGREALEEAFALQAAAKVEKKLRFEAEKTLDSFAKINEGAYDRVRRASLWIKGVDEAAARPENATIVEELRKTEKTDTFLRNAWRKIPGAPAPEQFGFNNNVNPEVLSDMPSQIKTQFMAYERHYFEMTGLDTGAYLTIPAKPCFPPHANTWIPLVIPSDWPIGDYIFRVRVGATEQATPERRFLEFGKDPVTHKKTASLSTHHITGTREAPQVIEIPYTLTSKLREGGNRTLFVRERGAGDVHNAVARFQTALSKNGIGPDLALWVDWLEIERKLTPENETPPGMRALRGIPLEDNAPAPSQEALGAALERFVWEAFRGVPAPKGTVDRLLNVYNARINSGAKHRAALLETLTSVLSAPRFLYRPEPESNEERRALNATELASRLSYFLWGAPPDAALLALAGGADLLLPDVLHAQVDRLLNDPRAEGFVTPFTTQWLLLDRLDLFQFNLGRYPRFDDNTKEAARNEVLETFAYLLKNNAPMSDLLKTDYVIINPVLAHYYGLEIGQGDEYRKVVLPAGSPRGGLLGMAAIMAMGSNGEHSNPVERGVWVLRKLLNDPPPPAPANVPEISRLAGKVLTTRERLQAHQEDPQCSSCHRKIDPIGFGLENFDAVGQWRTADSYTALDSAGKPDLKSKKTWSIEAAAIFYKGPAFQDYQAMRDILAVRTEGFARGFSAALIEYALGRPCGFSDENLVEDVVSQAKEKGLAAREFIHALVRSKEFHSK